MATLGEGEGPGGAGCASNAWMLQLVRGTEGILRMLCQCQQTSNQAHKPWVGALLSTVAVDAPFLVRISTSVVAPPWIWSGEWCLIASEECARTSTTCALHYVNLGFQAQSLVLLSKLNAGMPVAGIIPIKMTPCCH